MKSHMTPDAVGTDERDNTDHSYNGLSVLNCIRFICTAPSLLHIFLSLAQLDTSQSWRPFLRKKFEDDTMGTQRRFHDFTIQPGECMIASFGVDGGWMDFEPFRCDSGMILTTGIGGVRKTMVF